MAFFPVLQQCTQAGQDYLTNFEFVQAFTCTYAADVGVFFVGLVIWAAISLSIYVRTGSAAIPTVLMFVMGGVITSQVASVAMAVIVLLVLAIPAGSLTYAYYRYG